MAVVFRTSEPAKLLEAFRATVEDGSNPVWRCNATGQITHASHRWTTQAWFQPVVEAHQLAFYTLKPSCGHLTRQTYAFYQAQLAETFIQQFFDLYDEVGITPNANWRESA